mmetsp:Transcript_19274/g.44897  ORF Transcript_19274/g.44897 Transcript_19274/m.44897 type:complete len:218 (+) Transcript_19274:442-1095(+)
MALLKMRRIKTRMSLLLLLLLLHATAMPSDNPTWRHKGGEETHPDTQQGMTQQQDPSKGSEPLPCEIFCQTSGSEPTPTTAKMWRRSLCVSLRRQTPLRQAALPYALGDYDTSARCLSRVSSSKKKSKKSRQIENAGRDKNLDLALKSLDAAFLKPPSSSPEEKKTSARDWEELRHRDVSPTQRTASRPALQDGHEGTRPPDAPAEFPAPGGGPPIG